MIKVIVNGANGRMGLATVAAIEADPDLELVGKATRGDDLRSLIQSSGAQVVVDFTTAEVVHETALAIIESGVCPVIGTSGLQEGQVRELQGLAREKRIGGVVAPNFALGAVLMMKYAQDAAQYLPDVEIIELHHNGKIDSPSGTAVRTAELIAANKGPSSSRADSKETLKGARGAEFDGIHIHAVRLPGLIAHQRVIFGWYRADPYSAT